ncbi:MAG: hypothetical protein Q8Q03_00240 [bacterium]|nr:hypothetical protein [bacterium]
MKERRKTIRKIEYVDAHYSYRKQTTPPKGSVTIHGRIVLETNSYVDIEAAWTENPHKTFFGVVIPKAAICGNNAKNKMRKFSLSSGDRVAVYWQNIFAYDEDFKGLHLPTPMLTEGIFLFERSQHLVIDKPETLNLRTVSYHPSDRVVRYSIPKRLVSEIKILKK